MQPQSYDDIGGRSRPVREMDRRLHGDRIVRYARAPLVEMDTIHVNMTYQGVEEGGSGRGTRSARKQSRGAQGPTCGP